MKSYLLPPGFIPSLPSLTTFSSQPLIYQHSLLHLRWRCDHHSLAMNVTNHPDPFAPWTCSFPPFSSHSCLENNLDLDGSILEGLLVGERRQILFISSSDKDGLFSSDEIDPMGRSTEGEEDGGKATDGGNDIRLLRRKKKPRGKM